MNQQQYPNKGTIEKQAINEISFSKSVEKVYRLGRDGTGTSKKILRLKDEITNQIFSKNSSSVQIFKCFSKYLELLKT